VRVLVDFVNEEGSEAFPEIFAICRFRYLEKETDLPCCFGEWRFSPKVVYLEDNRDGSGATDIRAR
jgi:hypothetical protein